MEVDVVIENGKIVTPHSILEAGVAIDKGRFVALARTDELPKARRIIDAMGNFVLPGVIDEHVHLQDMDRSHVADFTAGSRAGAAGGVTTAMEMPLTLPATTTLEAFEAKKEAAAKKFMIDFALYGGAVPGNIDQIPKMVQAGAVGFKAMMAGSVPGLFEILDDGLLLETFRVIADCNSVITLHAENEAIVNHLESQLKGAGRKDVRAFFESRPIIQEVEAISRAAILAEEAGCHLHIVHVSCPQGIDIIYKRKIEGQLLTSETGPHYLVLSEDDMERLGPYMKFAPPARSKAETEQLWQQLADGKIDALGSDDGAHEKTNKEKGWENIWDAGSGAIGIETMLPVMLSEGVNKGRITIQQLVWLLSENPARIFGIYPQKGAIHLGSDADVVIVDMDKEHRIEAKKLHSKEKHTPYDGLRVKGMPVLTMVRGEVVMENGQIIGKPGYGHFVAPSR